MIRNQQIVGERTREPFHGQRAMEKARRKRVNNSLEQLRSLLPYSSSLKRDMASMLEQTVEYINTMHTVLNEEVPACLSKIYDIYRKKVEGNFLCKKATTPKATKRKMSDSGGCSSVGDAQNTPVEKRSQTSSCNDEAVASSDGTKMKTNHKESPINDKPKSEYQQTPDQQNWQQQQQQHIFETVCDMNDNYVHSFVGIPHPSDAHHGLSPFSYINIFGQSPLANQLVMCQKQTADQHSHFVPPFSKPSNGYGFAQDYCRPTIGLQSDGNPVSRWDDGPWSSQMHTAKSGNHIFGRKAPNFDINSLMYCPDQTEQRPSLSWNQWQGQQNHISCGFPPKPKAGNATRHLLAPMDMTISPSNGGVNSSPQYMGISKILEKDMPNLPLAGEDATSVFRQSSVSSMLNEVTGQTPCGAYGSTERKMSLLHGWSKSSPSSSNTTVPQYVVPTSESISTASCANGDVRSQNFEETATVFTPSSNTTVSASECDSIGFDLSQSNRLEDCRKIDHATNSAAATAPVKQEGCSMKGR